MELFFLSPEEYEEIAHEYSKAKVRNAKFVCGTPAVIARKGRESFLVKVNLDAGFEGTKEVWRKMAIIGDSEAIEVRYGEGVRTKIAQFLTTNLDKIEYHENYGILHFVPFEPDVYMKVNEMIDEHTCGEFFDHFASEIGMDYIEAEDGEI